MESDIFKNTFSNSLNSALKTDDPDSPFSISNNITKLLKEYKEENGDAYENKLKNESDESEKEREKYNSHLFGKIMGYLFLTFVIIFLIYIIKNVYLYYAKSNEPPLGFNRELSIHDIEENNNSDEVINDNLIPRPNEKSKYWKYFLNFGYYFLLAGLILLFEYIFFQYIVLEYHIISNKEIEYIVYSEFLNSLGRDINYLL